MEFKKGDVLCFEVGYDPMAFIVGNVISLFEKLGSIGKPQLERLPMKPSKIVHTAIVLNEQYYIQAVAHGIELMPLSTLKRMRVWHCVLKPELRLKIYANGKLFNTYLEEQIGKPYDWVQLLKFIPYLTTNRLLFKPKEDTTLNVCSELVASAFELVGICDHNSSAITPSDIFKQNWYKERKKIC